MRFVPLAAAAVLLISACGDDQQDGDESTAMPRCSDVWVEGEVLPEDYEGCRDGAAVVRPEFVDCEREDGRLTTYRSRYVALLGSAVQVVPGGPSRMNIFSC